MTDKFRAYTTDQLAKIYEDAAKTDEETRAMNSVTDKMRRRLGGDTMTFPRTDRAGAPLGGENEEALISLQGYLEGELVSMGGSWDPHDNRPNIPAGKEDAWRKVVDRHLKWHPARDAYTRIGRPWG